MLPFMDGELAERFIMAVAAGVDKAGATEVKVSGVGTAQAVRSAPIPPAATNGRHPAQAFLDKRNFKVRRSDFDTTADDIRRVLEQRGNPDLHYDDWIKIGQAIKSELPGAEGKAIWCRWSGLSSKNDPDFTARKWDTFKPERVTAGTVFGGWW